MHEFLCDFKFWQTQNLKPQFKLIKQNENECLKSCPKYEQIVQLRKCEKTCKQQRITLERYIYQKQSQFLQMVYRVCIQSDKEGQLEKDPNLCYQDFKENMELVQTDIEKNVKETLTKIT